MVESIKRINTAPPLTEAPAITAPWFNIPRSSKNYKIQFALHCCSLVSDIISIIIIRI